jgi:spermidine synthase
VIDYLMPNVMGATSQAVITVWGAHYVPINAPPLLVVIGAVLFVVGTFSLIALMFIPLGQLVGWYLENATNGISGYTVNILGSLTGIILYTLLCFLWQPPATWFLLAGLMLTLLLWSLPRLRWVSLAGFLICAGLAHIAGGQYGIRAGILGISSAKGGRTYWSPYQRLTLTPMRDGSELISYGLFTNNAFFQQMFNLSSTFVASHPQYFRTAPAKWNPYNLPYRFYPNPPKVLVLGAGTGNDVAAALRNGAGQVVAVEIDPLIVALGAKLHFEKPYSSPQVKVFVNDARSYVQNSSDRFDLIVYSLLDSHTNVSYYTNIRLDNYVYTLEALQATKRLLKPNGLMIIKFGGANPWISARLHELTQRIFGLPPLHVQGVQSFPTTAGRFFVSGSEQKVKEALSDPELSAYVASHSFDIRAETVELTTDDWPYFYQHKPGLPASIIIISAVLVCVCWFFLQETSTSVGSLRWHFFFLGAGFLLLEAQIISKMALLFGTTWAVNSIVIAALLILIVAANMLVKWKPRIPAAAGYVGIFASILVAYAVPLEEFFFASIWLKALTATAVLCLPVFFAGIVFIRSFAREGFRSEALGSNLFGALVGGLLESLSLWTGLRSLLIIAALLYLASWIGLRAQEPLAAFEELPLVSQRASDAVRQA